MQFTYFPPEERGKFWPYEARTKWRWWTAFGIAVAIIFVGSFLGSIFGTVFRTLGVGPGAGVRTPVIVTDLLVTLIFIAVFWTWFCKMAARAGGATLRDVLALRQGVGGWKLYAECAAAVICLVALYVPAASLIFRIDLSADALPMATALRGDWWPLALAVVVVGAPVSEEFIFRGFLQTALVQTRLGYWGGAVVSTTAWTLLHAHYSVAGMGIVFAMGILCVWYLRRSGSLYMAMFCHALYNLLVSLGVMFLPKAWLGF